MIEMIASLEGALARRVDLIEKFAGEQTDCYRLLHGASEGQPGLTVDRYGPQILVQSFHRAYEPDAMLALGARAAKLLGLDAHVVYHDRSAAKLKHYGAATAEPLTCHELGLAYEVRDQHRGQDPLLFLDLRAARRQVLARSAGRTVLNLFAYTCGVGLCAARGGASEVWNVDFAASGLAVGQRNALLNRLSSESFVTVQEDFFVVTRQLAGLGIKGRGARRPFQKFAPRCFDLVFLDPPAWGTSPFGAVDLKRDYQGLLKPALLCTAAGGELFCTNNLADVSLEDWCELLERAVVKAGRQLRSLELLEPEADFPPLDGRHALKLAVLHV